jgi:uncharacterized membrane protein YozB (DUF420 family)
MEEITGNGLIAILASICIAFCLGAALVFIDKRNTEKHWRLMDNE